jgi:hypothetical protein
MFNDLFRSCFALSTHTPRTAALSAACCGVTVTIAASINTVKTIKFRPLNEFIPRKMSDTEDKDLK